MNQIKQKTFWFVLAMFVFVVDQFTKYIAVDALNLYESKDFLSFFKFTLLHNYGAAFSFLSDAGGWQRWFFGGIALLVSALLIVWIVKLQPGKKFELAGLSLILGGAVGNLYDRMTLGYVIDFIDWFYPAANSCLPFFYSRPDWQTCHWPAFNVADSAILLGVSLLVIDILFFNTKEKS